MSAREGADMARALSTGGQQLNDGVFQYRASAEDTLKSGETRGSR